MDDLNISIYEREADGGGGGKRGANNDTGRSTRLPTGVFTPTEVDHMLCGRWRLLDYSLWSLTR